MKNKFVKIMASLVALALIAAMSLSLVSCNGETNANTSESQSTQSVESAASQYDGVIKVGEGETKFTFIVTFSDGSAKTYDVSTGKKTVGEALVEEGLISGSDSQYGLMVDTVCGEKHDFNEDGTYWAFYIDGNYAMTGVDSTDVTAGSTYEFKVES